MVLTRRERRGVTHDTHRYLPMHERVSYITQEITLVNSETVLDTMWFYANLTLPCHWTYAQKRCD